MNETLSSAEQLAFWTELFAVVVRREARKKASPEINVELLEEIRETDLTPIWPRP